MEKFVLKSITIDDEQENDKFRKTLFPGTYMLADYNAFQMYGYCGGVHMEESDI